MNLWDRPSWEADAVAANRRRPPDDYTKRKEVFAICESQQCTGASDNDKVKRMLKSVPYGLRQCPDCGYFLRWTTKRIGVRREYFKSRGQK